MAYFPAKFESITPSDVSTPKSYHEAYDYIYVGVAGDVSLVDMNGNTFLLKGLMPGRFHDCKFTRVNSTNTTATDIVAAHATAAGD